LPPRLNRQPARLSRRHGWPRSTPRPSRHSPSATAYAAFPR